MFGLAAGTVAPSAWAGLWQAAVERRGSLPKNALPRPQQAGCPQSEKTKMGMENQRGCVLFCISPRPLHPTPSPASHPISYIPPHPSSLLVPKEGGWGWGPGSAPRWGAKEKVW